MSHPIDYGAEKSKDEWFNSNGIKIVAHKFFNNLHWWMRSCFVGTGERHCRCLSTLSTRLRLYSTLPIDGNRWRHRRWWWRRHLRFKLRRSLSSLMIIIIIIIIIRAFRWQSSYIILYRKKSWVENQNKNKGQNTKGTLVMATTKHIPMTH